VVHGKGVEGDVVVVVVVEGDLDQLDEIVPIVDLHPIRVALALEHPPTEAQVLWEVLEQPRSAFRIYCLPLTKEICEKFLVLWAQLLELSFTMIEAVDPKVQRRSRLYVLKMLSKQSKSMMQLRWMADQCI